MAVVDFFKKLMDILNMPGDILHNAAVQMNAFHYDDSLLTDYLGYLHYAMGTPLYMLFSTIALIGVATLLWSLIMKALALIMDIIPLI